MPARLKGFFDRVFTPGFAFFEYEEGEGAGHEELLDDKTADLLVTMDMPPWSTAGSTASRGTTRSSAPRWGTPGSAPRVSRTSARSSRRPPRSASVSLPTAILASLTAIVWVALGVVGGAYGPLVLLSVPHALGLVWLLQNRLRDRTDPARIDGLMAASLSFLCWFGVVPLLNLA